MTGSRARRRRVLRPPSTSPSSAAPKSEINVTPLVDIVLVLLIIFMVVTPMLSRGAKVELPEAQHPERRNDTGRQVVVSLTVDGQVWVDAAQVTPAQVESAVRIAMARVARTGDSTVEAVPVHFKADRRLDYGAVRRVLDELHEAGAATVALGTEVPGHHAEGER